MIVDDQALICKCLETYIFLLTIKLLWIVVVNSSFEMWWFKHFFPIIQNGFERYYIRFLSSFGSYISKWWFDFLISIFSFDDPENEIHTYFFRFVRNELKQGGNCNFGTIHISLIASKSKNLYKFWDEKIHQNWKYIHTNPSQIITPSKNTFQNIHFFLEF